MGKTQPTYRDRVDRFEEDWSQYRRALRRRDQHLFDEIMEHIHAQAMAGGAQNHREPRWTFWIATAIGQQKQINDLQERVDALEAGDGAE